VLDLGAVTTGDGGCDQLCEIELELRAGSAQDLYAVALELATTVPLLVSDISKAERGYRLLQGSRTEAALPPLRATLTARDAFLVLAEQALNRIARSLERWSKQRDWEAADAAAQALAQLRATLDCFMPILPDNALVSLLPELAAVELECGSALAWRRLLPRLEADLAARWQAQQAGEGAARLDAVLRAPAFGCLLLQCGRLLILDDWPPAAAQPLVDFGADG